HVVPFVFAGLEQTPVDGLQVPTSWHWSCAAQVTGFAPVQVPASQVSVCVQALPSSQVVPFGFAGFEQTPVDGSQVPTSWHWSCAVQVTGFAPVQVPASQVSVCLPALSWSQVVPFGFAGLEQTPVDESHLPAS